MQSCLYVRSSKDHMDEEQLQAWNDTQEDGLKLYDVYMLACAWQDSDPVEDFEGNASKQLEPKQQASFNETLHRGRLCRRSLSSKRLEVEVEVHEAVLRQCRVDQLYVSKRLKNTLST